MLGAQHTGKSISACCVRGRICAIGTMSLPIETAIPMALPIPCVAFVAVTDWDWAVVSASTVALAASQVFIIAPIMLVAQIVFPNDCVPKRLFPSQPR